MFHPNEMQLAYLTSTCIAAAASGTPPEAVSAIRAAAAHYSSEEFDKMESLILAFEEQLLHPPVTPIKVVEKPSGSVADRMPSLGCVGLDRTVKDVLRITQVYSIYIGDSLLHVSAHALTCGLVFLLRYIAI